MKDSSVDKGMSPMENKHEVMIDSSCLQKGRGVGSMLTGITLNHVHRLKILEGSSDRQYQWRLLLIEGLT